MILQRQQPSYDPLAQLMQILQFALSQNQQVQQQQNQDRNFALDERQVNAREQQFKQSLLQQQQEQQYREQVLKQQEQQAIVAALSRVENQDGFQDPALLYQYLQQQGIQLPGTQMQRPPDPMAAKRMADQAIMSQLGQ